jgi:alkaline phosphatase D
VKIDRRAFLQAGTVALTGCTAAYEAEAPPSLESASTDPKPGAAGAAGPGGANEPPDTAVLDEALFPFGVLAGDMEPTRAVVWTKCAASVPLQVKVWDESGTKILVDVTIGEGGFVHHDVASLKPATRYRYEFRTNDKKSATGSFTTPPAAGAKPVVTFGAVSCTHQFGEDGWQAIGKAAGMEVDCFFHLGDHVYNDANGWLTTLEDFRASWKTCFDLPYMRAFHANQGVYFTWDDHEIINNWDHDWIAANPQYEGAVTFGTHTYWEHHPLRAKDRLWRSVKWGDTVELFVLDLRSERREDVGRRIMSREQMTWLKKALAASTATFKIIMNPIPVCTMPPSDAHIADRWEGFDAERTELLAWIRDLHLSGVWWISGDYHVGAVGRIDEYGYRWYGMHEVMMGPGAGHGADETKDMAAHVDGTIGEKQWSFATDASNFLLCTADPNAKTLRFRFVDGTGAVIHDATFSADHLPAGRTVGAAHVAKHAEKKAVLGEPLTNAHPTKDGQGTWQQFQWGYVYAHPQAGAHEIHGAILDRWAAEGWSQGGLGYPTTDEYTTADGKKEQKFQGGTLTFDPVTFAVTKKT